MNKIILELYELGDKMIQIDNQIVGLNGKKKELRQQYMKIQEQLRQKAATGKTIYDNERKE